MAEKAEKAPIAPQEQKIAPEKLPEYKKFLDGFRDMLPGLWDTATSKIAGEDGKWQPYSEFGIDTARYSFVIRPKLEPHLKNINEKLTDRLWNVQATQKLKEEGKVEGTEPERVLEIWFKDKNTVIMRYDGAQIGEIDTEKGVYESKQDMETLMRILERIYKDLEIHKAKYGEDMKVIIPDEEEEKKNEEPPIKV